MLGGADMGGRKGERGGGGGDGDKGDVTQASMSPLFIICLLVASVAVPGAVGVEDNVKEFLDNLENIEAMPGSYEAMKGVDGDLEPPSSPFADLDRFLVQSLMNKHLDSGKITTVGDLMAETNDLLEKGHLVLTRSFTEQAHRYNKAVRNVSSVVVTDAPVITLALEGEHPPTPDWSLHITALHLHTQGEHVFLLLGSLRNREQRVVVWSRDSRTVKTLAKFQLSDVSIDRVDKAATYLHRETLYMVMGSSHSRLVSVVCVKLSTGQITLPHVIAQRGVVGALHLFLAGDVLYLVVGESHHANPGDGLGRSEIYMLVGDFFDKQETLTMFGSSGVRDITSFSTSWGVTYIVLGMQRADGSQVYSLDTDSKMASISLVQELEERRVWKVAHFRDQADLKHFITMLNIDGTASVYWWNGNQLVRWQTLDTPATPAVSGGGSLALLPLPNFEHLIFTSSGANITIYTYLTKGTHEPSFIVTTECSAVRDLAAAPVGSDYVLVYVCEGPVSRVEARIVHLEALTDGREDMMGRQESQLSVCLDGLRGILDSRKPHVAILQKIVATDSLMTVDHAQVWTGPITVPELWVGQASTLQHTVVIPPGGGVAGNASMGEFEVLVSRLQTEVREVQASLNSVLYYGGEQTISNPVPGASIFATTAQFDVVSVHRLHGVDLKSLASEVLLDGPDQTITGHWQVMSFAAQRFNTRTQQPPGSINGIQTANYMRVSVAEQVVKGRHTYHTVSAGRVCHISGCDLNRPLLVNGLSTAAIVRQRQDVTFTARKTFGRLTVQGNVDVAVINRVPLAQVLDQVVFTDIGGVQVLAGRYSIRRLTVGGNLAAAAVNGLDVANLEKAMVMRRGDYRITGSLVYKTHLAVRGNTEVQVINGVPLGELLPLNTRVTVLGSYTFAHVTVTSALRSDNINGLDLSRDVVLSDSEQTIEGRISFLETVRVTGAAGVRMGQGVTVNGIDPSEVATEGNLGGGGVLSLVVEHEMNLPLMQVSGNVVISSINGVTVADLETMFWRKSVAQEIGVPVHIKETVFLAGVEGSTLNGHAMTEYLQLNANQRITGHYSFESNVEVAGNIVVAEGRTVAGVDVSTLPGRVVTVDEPQTLEGEVRFSGRVTVLGDLDLHGDFSGLEVLSKALKLDQTIEHTGHLTFAGGALMNSLQVTSSDLTVTSVNGMDVAAAAADLVLVDEDATITGGGGVRFSGNVNIREVRVSGLVDGVDISRMLSRALRTASRTPQVVPAALTVEGNVHFTHGPTLARVNGEDWTAYLGNVVQVGYSGRIEGRKLFTGGLHLSGNLQAKSINGVDLTALASRILRKSTQQRISAHYTFMGDVTADELSAPVIDGVVMDEVLLVGSAGHLAATVTFAEEVTLLAGLTADSNILDSCDFGKIQTEQLIGGDEQSVVDLPGIEIDTLVVEGQSILTTTATITTTTNLDITRLLHSLVLKSTDQVITGSVTFLNDVRVGKLDAALVDGVDVQALYTQAVLRGQDVVIECDLHLTEGLQVGRLEVTGNVGGVDEAGVLVNGVDLSAVAGRAVRRGGGPFVLQGRKVFTAGLVTGHLRAVTIAGVPVQDIVVVVGGGAVSRPPPRLVFGGPLVVLGNLWVSRLVDGVDLAELFAQRITMDGHQILTGSYRFEALRVEGDITTSSINNVSLDDLVLRTGLARQVITGPKFIEGGLQVRGALHVGSLNGVDVAELNRTIVRLDQGTVAIRGDVRFEGSVQCLAGTEVVGTVNGHDLSVLAQRVSQIQQRLVQERRRIDGILGQFGSLNDDNYIKARELYAEMASLERIFLPRETSAYGMLWWGAVPGVSGGQVLRITSCNVLLCGCDLKSQYFLVGNDTRLTPVPHLSSNQAIMTHLLNGQHLLVLVSQCVGGNMQVKVSLAHRPSASLLLQGLLVDSAVFQADGEDYLVAALYRNNDDGYGTEASTEVVVVSVNPAVASLYVAKRWVPETLVTDLDVTFAGDSWFLALANSFGVSSVDKYVTASQILRWDAASKQFVVASQHLASHVHSGSFVQVMGETFMVLTQDLPHPPPQASFAASCSSKVMVYRYNKSTRQFVEFQSIPAFGVVSQATLRVDRSVYLVLASPTEHCLYVCLYKHSEGFVVISQVFLMSPLSVVSLSAGEDMYILVSTIGGVERYKVFVKGVDPDTLYL